MQFDDKRSVLGGERLPWVFASARVVGLNDRRRVLFAMSLADQLWRVDLFDGFCPVWWRALGARVRWRVELLGAALKAG